MEVAFTPFAKSVSVALLAKLQADAKSMIGRLEANTKSKIGACKATSKFQLKSKEGHTLQLPPNNALAQLLCFGMRINELEESAGIKLDATIPKIVTEWIATKEAMLKSGGVEIVAEDDATTVTEES